MSNVKLSEPHKARSYLVFVQSLSDLFIEERNGFKRGKSEIADPESEIELIHFIFNIRVRDRRDFFMQRGFNFFRQLFALAIIFSSLFSIFGQTRRTTPRTTTTTTKVSANTPDASNPGGGWSGVITFTKTLTENFDSGKVPAFGRIDKERNYTITTRTREFKYEGKVFVDGSRPQVVTKSQVIFSDEDKEKGKMVIVDSCHAFNDEHEFIDNSSNEKITKAFAEAPAQNFNLYVDVNYRYNLSLKFPDAKGIYTDASSLTRSGYCQPKNNEPKNSSNKYEATQRGESFSVDGFLDRTNPDVLRGSKSWDDGSFKVTATWNLRRRPGELEIENIAFDEHPFPDFTDWRENTSGYIADSNIVRIRATIVNYSTETKFPKIEFKETKENIALPDGEINISIGPGEEREVIYMWDTSGFAWGAGATKMENREIKVELTEQQKREKTKPINIFPKPVILAHGLWADASAWDGYDAFLRRAYGADWKAVVVRGMNTGEKGSLKQTNTIKQNSEILATQIYDTQREMNAWHVDVVAHSMGGLITRYYINSKMQQVPDGKPVVQHLAMLGTPNMGSPCANLIHRTIAPFGTKVNALAELDKGSVDRFNDYYRNNRGVKMSNLVGMLISPTCISPEMGDGVVEWTSAVWRLSDVRFVPEIHTKLTDEQYFRSYVLPRLAISRNGNHLPAKELGSAFRQNQTGAQFLNAAWNAGDDDSTDAPQDFQINAGKQMALAAKQSAEIEIPVSSAGNSGITIVAPPAVAATLFDEKGVVVGQSAANTPEANADFRAIPITKPMSAAWKLKLENTGAKEAEAIVSAWTNTNPNQVSFTLSAGKPTAAAKIPLQAKLVQNGAAVTNVTVTAKILGEAGEITLLDDGQSGDGAANDGVYGALVNKPANEDFVVVAKTEVNGKTLQTAAVASPATKPTVKPTASLKTRTR
jgi:pimeloyl-ACP methyl ester carboxylesterase